MQEGRGRGKILKRKRDIGGGKRWKIEREVDTEEERETLAGEINKKERGKKGAKKENRDE